MISQRQLYLDITRAIAIMFVVAIHTLQRVPITLNISFLFASGVPLFLLISGGLIIPKAEALSVTLFFKKYYKRLIQFVLLIPICGIITNTLVFYCMGTNVSLPVGNSIPSLPNLMHIGQLSICDAFLKALTEANGVMPNILTIADSHTWYLYLITCFYFLSPFLARITKRATKKEILFLFLLICIPCHIPCEIRYSFIRKIVFFASYFYVFLLGYLIIHRNIASKGSFAWSMIVLCGIMRVGVYPMLSILGWDDTLLCTLLHGIPYRIFIPAFILIIVRDYGNKLYCRFIKSLSYCSFGIYLWHFAFLWILSAFFPMSTYNTYLRCAVFFAVSLGASWLLSIILQKFKWTRWLVS